MGWISEEEQGRRSWASWRLIIGFAYGGAGDVFCHDCMAARLVSDGWASRERVEAELFYSVYRDVGEDAGVGEVCWHHVDDPDGEGLFCAGCGKTILAPNHWRLALCGPDDDQEHGDE